MSNQAEPCLRRRSGFLLAVVVGLVAGWASGVSGQSKELIIDLLTTPNRYWNKTVVLRGHVRSVAANPPGTNRGSFVLRDPSDADIAVITNELPAQGKEYTVTGLVEQSTPGDDVPFIRETSRYLGLEPPAPKPMAPAPAAPVSPPAAEARPRERVPEPARSPAQPDADAFSRAPAPSVAPAAAPAAAPAVPAVTPVSSAAVADAPMATSRLFLYFLAAAAVVLGAAALLLLRRREPAPAPAAPSSASAGAPVARPAAGPAPQRAPADPAATRFIPPGSPGAPALAATQVYVDVGVELVVIDGPDKGQRFPISKPLVRLGRSGERDNDVALTDETVSRSHARLVYNPADQRFSVVNETPVNPTKLNGAVIDTAAIRENDVIQLGATSLRFRKVAR